MSNAIINLPCVNRYEKGFTLLELVITLVIAVSITAISATAYSRLSTSAALKTTTQDLLVTLRHARNRAISSKKESVFIIDMNTRQYRIAGEQRIRLLDDSLAVQLFSARFDSKRNSANNTNEKIAQIRFAPDGSSSGGEIKISNDKKYFHILVEWLTGKVELKHG